MKRVRGEVIMASHDKMGYVTEPEVVDSIRPSVDRTSVATSADVDDHLMVGFEDEMQRLKEYLFGGTRELDVISIVGIDGSGKTTIATKLYNDMLICHHFDCRSFIKVSQVHDVDKLKRQILRDLTGDDDTFYRREIGELGDSIRKFLFRRRFLIVVDELWGTAAWDDLCRFFPDTYNGSRILLTTRFSNLALYAKRMSDPHFLRPLSKEESWELLQMKLFQQQSCPPELADVGYQIVKQCQGLPLMIVLIADILARKKNDVDSWTQVCKSIPIDKGEYLLSIIEQQYMDLPDYLRQCFLYFGAFPLDHRIPVSKLIRLWTAEGFVQHAEEKSFEEVAMDYLLDLIGRNLVTVCRRSSEGLVKSCKIHDRMHDLCIIKAKEKSFLLMEGYGKVSNRIHHGVDPNYSNVQHSVKCEHRRLFISSNGGLNTSLEVSGPLVRSLVLIGERSDFSGSNISIMYQDFKLLRVLDLGCTNVGNAFPAGLEKMVLLRYLAVRGEMTSIPSSIGSLQQLETFVTIGLRGEVSLPDEIWKLKNLRHLHINDRAFFPAPDYSLEFSEKLPNLRTMSNPSLSYGEDSREILRRLSRLEKLKCIFLEAWDSHRKKNMFPRLDLLTQLHSLKLFYHGPRRESCQFNFPLALRSLTLVRFCLPWDQISVIAELPRLEVLKLQYKAFEGSVWDVEEGAFPSLKFLRLDMLDLADWNASEDSFPILKRLELRKCKKLREIPSSFVDILTLEVIEVKSCSQSVQHSALQIKEELEEFGNEMFKVIIDKEDGPAN